MTFARHGAFWSNEKMERVAGDASFFLSLSLWATPTPLPTRKISFPYIY
jgi:hypothetical protein